MDLNNFYGHGGMGREPAKINPLDYDTDIEICCLCWTMHPDTDMEWIPGQGLTCKQCLKDNYKPYRISSHETDN